jgi:hypothetical protein
VCRWHETQIYVDRLSGLFGGAQCGLGTLFFPTSRSIVFHSPASFSIRRTVFGLTNGTQLLALASSCAMRFLRHSECSRLAAMTCRSISSPVARPCSFGARLARNIKDFCEQHNWASQQKVYLALVHRLSR